MAYKINSNTTGSWDGKQGSEVLEIIGDEFLAAADAINGVDNKTPIKINGELSTDKTSINLWLESSDGKISGSTYNFSTVTLAEYKLQLDITTADPIIKYGTSFTIGYEYSVLDGSDMISGYRATVLMKINGVVQSSTYTVYSKSGRVSTGTFVIDSSKLKEGANTIILDYYTETGSNTLTATASKTISVYAASVSIRFNASLETLKPKAFTDSFTMSFSVGNSAGNAISYSYQEGDTVLSLVVKKRVYFTQLDSLHLAYSDITDASITTSLSDLVTKCSANYNASNVKAGQGVFKVYVQAYITNSSNEEITSSVPVVLYYINTDCTSDNDLRISGIFYPTTVNDDGSFSWTKSLYDSLIFSTTVAGCKDLLLQVYSTSDTTASLIIGSSSLNISVAANDLLTIDYTYLCRISASSGLQLKCGNPFESTLIVNKLTTGLLELTDYALRYDCNDIILTGDLSSLKWSNNGYAAVYDNFDWSLSTWVSDSVGKSLQITGGALLTIPYKVYNIADTDTGYAISFRYKVNNSLSSEKLIKCLDGTNGFYIAPGYIYFNNGESIKLNIDDSEVHEVSFVLYKDITSNGVWANKEVVYIDGKIQLIQNIGSIPSNNLYITAQATDSILNIYNVTIFKRALSFTEVLSLYCFNSKTGTALTNYIKNNLIFDVSSSTDIINNSSEDGIYGLSVTIDTIPDGSLYLVLTSRTVPVYKENSEIIDHYESPDPTPWLTINSYVNDTEEANKGRRHTLGSVALYEKNGNTARNFYASPATMSAQGTSSMKYALKNFRFYLAKGVKNPLVGTTSNTYSDDNYPSKTTIMYLGIPENFVPDLDSASTYTTLSKANGDSMGYQLFSSTYSSTGVDSLYTVPSAPADTFCLKADMAESSGAHNTGFARLANMALQNSGVVTNAGINPNETSAKIPQLQLNGDWDYDVRMNIDGRPVYLFFHTPECYPVGTTSVTEEAKISEKYYYAGRYNMNNDKSNEKVFGFCDVTEYFNNDTVKAEGVTLAKLANDSGYDPYYATTHNAYGIKDNGKYNSKGTDYINPTECWEFSTNENDGGLIGAFNYDKSTAFSDTDASATEADYPEYNVLKWLQAWEYRYPDLEGAGDGHYRKHESTPYLLRKTYDWLYDNNYYITKSHNTLNSFASNLKYYFNVNALLKYYVLTNWFGARDQRVKNCMISFYCNPNEVSASDALASPLHYMRAYFIFYDNDTILGLNNDGYLDINDDGSVGTPWNFEEGDNVMAFSGKNCIWNNLSNCHLFYLNNQYTSESCYALGELIAKTYLNLRSQITDGTFDTYFNTYHVEYYPDAIQNVDTEIKYLFPDQLRNNSYSALANDLKKDTGTRQLYRDNWFKKRSIWLDDLNNHTNALNYVLGFKGLYDPGSDEATQVGDIKYSIVDSFKKWKLYFLNSDGNVHYSCSSWSTTENSTFSIPLAISGNTNSVIYGLYAVKSLEFLNEELQMSGFGITGQALPYLNSIKINKATADSLNGFINATLMPNLKELVLHNVSSTSIEKSFSTLDFTSYNNLQTIDLTGTTVSKVTPDAAVVTLALTNPTELVFNSTKALTTITINGNENLNKLTVTKGSSVTYNTALELAASMAASTISSGNPVTININFNGDEVYGFNGLSDTYIGYLLTIAKIAIDDTTGSTFNISGTVLVTGTLDTDAIETAFGNTLTISRSDSTTPILDFYDANDSYVLEGNTTYEGTSYNSVTVSNLDVTTDTLKSECTIFSANKDIKEWKFKIDGDSTSTLNNSVSILKTASRKCWVHVNPDNTNTSQTHTFELIAITQDDVELTFSTSIKYMAITSMTLSTDDTYTTTNATIKAKFNTNTKKHLLTSDNFTVSPSIANINYINSGNVEISTNAISEDTTFTVTFGTNVNDTITSNITIYYNSYIGKDASGNDLTLTELASTSNSKYWISLIPAAIGDNSFGDYITKSKAASITLTSTITSSIYASLGTVQDLGLATQDFTDLLYFNSEDSFILPTSVFSTLTTPKGATKVSWASNGISNNIISAYKTIIFTSNIKIIDIGGSGGLELSGIPDDLVFDLSRTSIKRIANINPTNLTTYEANINIVYTGPNAPEMRTTSLFIYPDTLEEIGNYGSISSNVISFPSSAMFNYNSSAGNYSLTGNYSSPALFNLSGFNKNVTLGLIASYPISGSAFTSFERIPVVKYAFPRNSNILVTNSNDNYYFDCSSFVTIGDGAFSRIATGSSEINSSTPEGSLKLIFGNISDSTKTSVATSIGSYSFHFGRYLLRTNLTSTDVIFDKVTTIGDYAFCGLTLSLDITLGSATNPVTKIGTCAFLNLNSITYTIRFNLTLAITSLDTLAFKNSGSTTPIVIYAPANSDLYTLLDAMKSASSASFTLNTIS